MLQFSTWNEKRGEWRHINANKSDVHTCFAKCMAWISHVVFDLIRYLIWCRCNSKFKYYFISWFILVQFLDWTGHCIDLNQIWNIMCPWNAVSWQWENKMMKILPSFFLDGKSLLQFITFWDVLREWEFCKCFGSVLFLHTNKSQKWLICYWRCCFQYQLSINI